MKHNKAALFIKIFLLSLPFLTLIVIYVVKDPFMLIRHHDDYDDPIVFQSESCIGWMKYKMFRDKMHYDSFIMGDSDTKAFGTHEWNEYIHAHPFRMFGNSEQAGDILLKLQALDRQPGQKIKNLLIVVEYNSFADAKPQAGRQHIMPPEVAGISKTSFQVSNMQYFMYPQFTFAFLKYSLTHRFSKCMAGIINQEGRIRTRYTNDAITRADLTIPRLGEHYWDSEEWDDAKSGKYSFQEQPRTIFSAQEECLTDIHKICVKQGTDVKIVISPSIVKKSINRKDVAVLKKIFGEENVFDYSDPAQVQYTDYHNFYDRAHYRRSVGNEIMKQIYSGAKQQPEP